MVGKDKRNFLKLYKIEIEDVELSTNNDKGIYYNELLEILVKFSLKTLCEFSFCEEWKFIFIL